MRAGKLKTFPPAVYINGEAIETPFELQISS